MYSSASLGDTVTKCEDVPTVDDEDETEDSEGGRGSLKSVSDHFPLDTQGSPREDRSSPAEDSMDRMEPGQCFNENSKWMQLGSIMCCAPLTLILIFN